MSAVRHKPTPPLPWNAALAENYALSDPDYIAHTANAYPRLVTLARRMAVAKKYKDREAAFKLAGELLTELGEIA